MIEVIAFDGDDTLWHNEGIFADTQARYRELLAHRSDPAVLDERLLDTERRNLELFGYGVKGFMLSMIETAIEVTEGAVTAGEVQQILELGKEMLAHPVELIDGVDEVVAQLAAHHRLVLVTKGDLFHQESKIARSGLADFFERIEIVHEKDERTFARVIAATRVEPARFVMVGNSVRSDVLPVLALGGRAVHVPYHLTWELEHAEPPTEHDGYWSIDTLRELPELVATVITRSPTP
ncbi:MAG TPA: HAD family hydrolase [Acidimicrobiia bacterium]|nr:HAD family hydrolase [Acidimicrobiia bacterium]